MASCFLSLVISMMLLFKFILNRVFRNNTRDEWFLSEPAELNQELPALAKCEDFMDENVPSFKNLEDKVTRTVVEEESRVIEYSEKKDKTFLIAAGLHNDGFLSEPESTTFHVQEPFVCLEEEEEHVEIGINSLLLHQKGRAGDFLDLNYGLYGEEKPNSLTSETCSMRESEFRFISDDFCASDFEFHTESSSDVKSVEISDDGEAKAEEKLPSLVDVETSMERNSQDTSPESELIGNAETELGCFMEFLENSSDDEFSFVKNGGKSTSEVLDTEEVVQIVDDLTNSSNISNVPGQKADGYDDARKASQQIRKKLEESEALNFDEELDELWEHQEIVEKLKMELKKVRDASLPTMPEESDSLSRVEDMELFRSGPNFHSSWEEMASYFLSLLISMLLLFRFILNRVFRNNTRDEWCPSEPAEMNQELPALAKCEGFMDENVPAFKNLEDKFTGTEVEEESRVIKYSEKKDKPFLIAAGLHNYGFLSEAKNMTFHVHETHVCLEEEEEHAEKGNSLLLLHKKERAEDFFDLNYGLCGEEKPNSLTSETCSMGESEFRFISDDFCGSNFEFHTESSSDVDSVEISDDGEAKAEEKLPSLADVETSMERNSQDTSPKSELIGKAETELGCLMEFLENSNDGEFSFVKNGGESKLEVVDTDEVVEIEDGLTNSSNVSTVPRQKVDGYDDAWKASEPVKKKLEESEAPDFNEELDELWEHQEIVAQLRMELKKVRDASLPTIPEESNRLSRVEDMELFRSGPNFLREDPLDVLQNFYTSYSERMRKFDILNYQKLYAMGFMQLKSHLHSIGTQGKFFSKVMSYFSQRLLFCHKKPETNPSEKLIEDMQRDMETVYVGQTCLSWEFLRWQYEKSYDLLESHPHRICHYNDVAEKFQQFKALVQIFMENEPFQGPRFQTYVQQRCVLGNLLQVPVMNEDRLKDNMENVESKYHIHSEMLEVIMEEAVGVFWDFINAEKHETSFLPNILVKNVELEDPTDYLFMRKIQSDLQKKKKKLKDLQRSNNCKIKNFKKSRKGRPNKDLFFSEVDLKLVSRVLKMSRVSSDHLTWCHQKLSKINFSGGKVHTEPSFLLFPC